MEEIVDPKEKFIAPSLFLGFAVIYNALLAILNAHVVHVSQATVIATEGIIVLGAVAYLITKIRYLKHSQPVFLFQLAMLVIFLGVTLLSEYLNIKAFRDIFLISIFSLLGSLITKNNIIKVFSILCALTFIFLLLEAYATDVYANIFNPASYYANTRGLENPSFNNTGVFANSLSFEGRFSLGIFNFSHRLSSIFLEQVSLGNFSIILAIFLSIFWTDLSRRKKILFIATLLFMLPANNSRTAIILCVLILIGHHIFPKLPKYTHILYLPLSLIVVMIFFNIPGCISPNGYPVLVSDDLIGRLGLSACTLRSLELENIFGFSSRWAAPFWDSGYVYFINGQSMFGLLYFWIFCSLLIPPSSSRAIRINHYLAIAIFINMYTSMALFSIKVAGPLWFIVGHIYMQQKSSLWTFTNKKKFTCHKTLNDPVIGCNISAEDTKG